MSKEWYLSTSDDYLSGFENEEFILNATSAFEELLVNSPEAYLIEINGLPSPAIVQNLEKSESKNLLTRLNAVKRGDLITYKNEKWLIIDHVDDNKMYQSCEMKLCNTSLPLPGTEVCKVVGVNDFGEDIVECTSSDPFQIPCIVERTAQVSSTDQAIMLPDGRANITMPYTVHKDLAIGKHVRIFNEDYEIADIDYSKTIGTSGLMILIGKKGDGE